MATTLNNPPPDRPLNSELFSGEAWAAIARNLELSGREREIVQGVFDDKTEFAIAVDLGISPHTIHTHFERLHRKLHARDRTQILLHIVREFLTLTAVQVSAEELSAK